MNGKVYRVCNRDCFLKMKDFLRLGPLRAVTHTVKVVVSKKWCKIDTLILQTTNRTVSYTHLTLPTTPYV